MSGMEVSLDAWAEEVVNRLKAGERELLALFQKDWLEGHRHNPLLYPLNQDPEVWRDNFDWFVTVENFVV